MAKTLIIYPFADGTIGHSKSNTSSTAASLVNEPSNSTTGYLSHSFTTASTTNVSSFRSLTQASDVTLGKVRINSISSVNLYLSITKGSNATLSNINIFGSVSINGNTYQSASYRPTAAVSASLQTLAISNANINRTYASLSAANIEMSFSSTGSYTTSSDKNNDSYLRVYNANVTISYDDVFDCGVQIVAGNGIATASASSAEVIGGENCTFTATVDSGYEFEGWYDNSDFDGDAVSTDLTFTLRITENTTLYPKAKKEGVVPPEEDPDKVFYPITISSINARTSPSKGTTKVESGTTKTIKITPRDPQLTLALDNGVDISSQLVQHGGTIQDPTIATAPNAAYGFNLSASTGYYASTNARQANSAAVCRVTFNLPVRCLVTIQYINYAEATYDYGIFGNIDSALSTASTVDTNVKLACSTNAYNISTPQTLTYEVQSGTHFIDIKYRKDTATDSNNDNLQFKILSIEPIDTYDFYYTYELQNINQEHSLTFVFGNVQYFFVTSQTDTNASLYPYGQTVILPGDEYKLTIVPEDQSEVVTLKDNGTDVTSQLETINVETQKDGQTIIIINYIYRLANVQATHNLVVETTKQTLPQSIKLNGNWVRANFFYKANGVWTQVGLTDIYSNNGVKWIRATNSVIKTNNVMFIGNINNGG